MRAYAIQVLMAKWKVLQDLGVSPRFKAVASLSWSKNS